MKVPAAKDAPTPPIKVLLVDDHALVREGLEGAIAKCDDLVIVGSVGSSPEALALCRQQDVNVVLLDMRMDGLEVLANLRQKNPQVAVVMLTSDDRGISVQRALDAGAVGFLPKTICSWDLSDAIRNVVNYGHLPLAAHLAQRQQQNNELLALTSREQEVLVQMAEGGSNEDIAATLNVSLNTVKTHVKQHFRQARRRHPNRGRGGSVAAWLGGRGSIFYARVSSAIVPVPGSLRFPQESRTVFAYCAAVRLRHRPCAALGVLPQALTTGAPLPPAPSSSSPSSV